MGCSRLTEAKKGGKKAELFLRISYASGSVPDPENSKVKDGRNPRMQPNESETPVVQS